MTKDNQDRQMLRVTLALRGPGFDKLERKMANFRQALPGLAAKAINDATRTLQAAETAEISRVFDRPTRFTLAAVGAKFATPQRLEGEAFVKGLQEERYLDVQLRGGARRQKVSERRFESIVRGLPALVPGGIKLDASGNVPRRELAKVLAEAERGIAARTTSTKKRRGAKKNGPAFVLRDAVGQPVGVFRREGRKLVALLLATRRAPTYRQRFDFVGVARRELTAEKLADLVARRMQKELDR